jgi:hypothetical protein
MKAVLLFSYFMFLMSGTLFAQNDSSKHKPKDVIEPANLNNPTKPKYNISFFKTDDKEDTIHRNNQSESLWSVTIVATDVKADALKDYTIELVAENDDDDKSKLPSSNFEIVSTINGKQLNDLAKSNPIRVIIKKEDESFKQFKPLKLVLSLKVKKKEKGKDGKDNEVADEEMNNEGKIKKITLVVLPSEEPLLSYKFLGYLGTNFDLVDGVQAKNLFFATNIFIPENKRWGFSLGLYGNRTMTRTDTSKQTSFESKIVKINTDSIARYFDTATKVTTRVSDNIGINFMPLIALNSDLLNDEGPLKLYYAPQFEFIWRRTTLENAYLNQQTLRIDSMRNRFPANTSFPLITPASTKVDFNVYDVYLGLVGLLLRYETEDISVRINSSVGINLNYTPLGALSNGTSTGNPNPVYPTYNEEKRFFFFGRLWITEPTTGLTLGAEVSNYFGKREVNRVKVSNAQPYYNVTLSKAFNLKNLAAFVKPLTNR